jgi:hypothetical protein
MIACRALVLLGATALSGCRSEAAKQCVAEYDRAQAIVRAVESSSVDSLEQSVAAIDKAMTLCRAAGRDGEVEQLTGARHQIAAHLELVKRKAANKKPAQTPAEIAELERRGDPKCPAGQFYKHRISGKDIRCTGPQMVEMTWEQAAAYFRSRGYKVTTKQTPPEVRAEYGAELFVFGYAREKDTAPPRCLTIQPPPEGSWQEAAARATGVQPSRLERNEPVRMPRGEIGLSVEDAPGKQLVRLGVCGA